MRIIYLDYAATTPVDPRVFKAMRPYFGDTFGNPGSVHRLGQEAMAAVDNARQIISKALEVDFGEIIFTGSATEANNLALRGAVIKALRVQRRAMSNARANALNASRSTPIPRIVVSAIEHESVLETAKDLECEGIEVVYVPVDREGFVNPREIGAALNDRTILVSVMWANNETGTIEPVRAISDVIKACRAERLGRREFEKSDPMPSTRNSDPYPIFHIDAVQGFQYLPCHPRDLGADLLTLSSHKIYGPKGIGLMYARKEVQGVLDPLTVGGGQEYGLRSGTENVPYIAGFGKAVEIVEMMRVTESKRVAALRAYLWKRLKGIFPEAELNGPALSKRLPNNLNVYFPGEEAQYLLTKLDLLGIAASAGSACSARSLTPSYVIEALWGRERAKQSIRLTLGRMTAKRDLDEALRRLSAPHP